MKITTRDYLNTIAGCLWEGQASLFVGAGFSKNANLQSGASMPPNWDELGDLFFEKTDKKKPDLRKRAYSTESFK